ncbi:MAG TPA: hypothetical protein VF647_08500 [Longimicrobium sp.]|jgi:hypothetical protein
MQALQPRARRPGEILNAAFQIILSHYDVVVLASAVFLVPGILIMLVLPERSVVVGIIGCLLMLAASTAVMAVVSDIYTGGETDVRRSVREVVSRSGSILGASIFQGILLVVGFLMLVGPAFIFYAWTFAMPAAVVLEGAGAYASYGRSRALTNGFMVHILTTVVAAWAIFGVALLGGMLAIVVAMGLGLDPRYMDPLLGVVVCLVYPFVSAVTTVLYYDLRIRQEGFDAQRLSGPLNPEAPV